MAAAYAYTQAWVANAPPNRITATVDAKVLLDQELSAANPSLHAQLDSLVSKNSNVVAKNRAAGIKTLNIQDQQKTSDVNAAVVLSQTVDRATLPQATHGLALTRTVWVRRAAGWLRIDSAHAGLIKIGDWLQVRLLLSVARDVQMLSLTDPLPGAITAVDPTLSGQTDAAIASEAARDYWNDGYFGTRVLTDSVVQFYSDYLPAGQHELRYVAQVKFAGDYAWLGADAELMYTPQVNGRSGALRLRVH